MHRFLAGSLIILLAGSVPRAKCSGRCLCVGERDPVKAVAASSAVFEAVALAYTFDAPMTRDSLGNDWYHVPLVVGRVWKGVLSDTVTIQTPSPAGACGLSFTPGGHFLVFAVEGPRGSLAATVCSLSQEWGTADSTVAQLGAPIS